MLNENQDSIISDNIASKESEFEVNSLNFDNNYDIITGNDHGDS